MREGGEPMSEPAPYRPLLTIDEAAAYLNVPARWVADAVRQRKLRCTRIGKHVRFRVEHLEELVAAGEQPVTSPAQPLALVPQPLRRGGRLGSDWMCLFVPDPGNQPFPDQLMSERHFGSLRPEGSRPRENFCDPLGRDYGLELTDGPDIPSSWTARVPLAGTPR